MQPTDANDDEPESLMTHLTAYYEPGDDGTRGDMVQRYPTDAKPERCEWCGDCGWYAQHIGSTTINGVPHMVYVSVNGCPKCGTGVKPKPERCECCDGKGSHRVPMFGGYLERPCESCHGTGVKPREAKDATD